MLILSRAVLLVQRAAELEFFPARVLDAARVCELGAYDQDSL